MRCRRAKLPATLLGTAFLLVVWEIAVRAAKVPAFVVPPPSTVVRELWSEPGLFSTAVVATIGEALGGFLVAALAALTFAAVAAHSRLLDRLLTPIVIVSQTIPVITLAPLLVLWFGYGSLPRVIVCALVAFFPMAVTTLEGFRSTDPDLLLLLSSVNASKWTVFWRVRLPHSGPFLVAGAKTGATLSLVGAVVAEWTGAGRGLGYIVLSANSRLATAQAFAAVVLVCALGMAAHGCITLFERRIGWWSRTNLNNRRMSV